MHSYLLNIAVNIGLLLSFPLKTIQLGGGADLFGAIESYVNHVIVWRRDQRVSQLSSNGSGPGNKFTVNVHIKRPVIHFPLAFY